MFQKKVIIFNLFSFCIANAHWIGSCEKHNFYLSDNVAADWLQMPIPGGFAMPGIAQRSTRSAFAILDFLAAALNEALHNKMQ